MLGVCGAEFRDTSHVTNAMHGAKRIQDVWATLLSNLKLIAIIVLLSPHGSKVQVQAVLVATPRKSPEAVRNLLEKMFVQVDTLRLAPWLRTMTLVGMVWLARVLRS